MRLSVTPPVTGRLLLHQNRLASPTRRTFEMSGTSGITIEALTELVLNLGWSWHRGTDELWAQYVHEC